MVVAIDGHSGSGKSTLATGLATRAADTAVVHTDDIAWHHSFFGWGHLLIDNLLAPIHDGRSPICYTPDAWTQRGRPGAITIPATTSTVIVEGVGSAARELRRLMDVVVWVHVSAATGRDRVIARGVDTDEFIDDWTRQENTFLAQHRSWDAADLWVNGDIGGGDTIASHVQQSPQ